MILTTGWLYALFYTAELLLNTLHVLNCFRYKYSYPFQIRIRDTSLSKLCTS